MSDQPTGEWTPEWLRRVITEHWNEPEREVICRAHKAALASADERLLSDDRKNLSAAAIALTKADTQIMELRDQLTAEREKTREFAELAVKAERELNAEREKVTLATQMAHIESKRANEAEQNMQTLVDALRLLADDGPLVDYRAIARTALAKVKE